MYSESTLVVHHKAIGDIYHFTLDGFTPILTSFIEFEKVFEKARDSSVNPDNVVLPHPALNKGLVVFVFTTAMRLLVKQLNNPSAGNSFAVFSAVTAKAESVRTFNALRTLLSEKSVAELGPLVPVTGMVAGAVASSGAVAAALTDTTSSQSRQRSRSRPPASPAAS
jgi:hypothetical protein